MASPGGDGDMVSSGRKRHFKSMTDGEVEEGHGGAGAGPLMPKRVNLMAAFGGRTRAFGVGRGGSGPAADAGGSAPSSSSVGGLPAFPSSLHSLPAGFDVGAPSEDSMDAAGGGGGGGGSARIPGSGPSDDAHVDRSGENSKRSANAVFDSYGASGRLRKPKPAAFGGSSSSNSASRKYTERDVKFMQTKHMADLNKLKAKHQFEMLQREREMEELAASAEARVQTTTRAADARVEEVEKSIEAELTRLREEGRVLKKAFKVLTRQAERANERILQQEAQIAQQEGQIAVLREALRLSEMGVGSITDDAYGSGGHGLDPPPPPPYAF